MSSPADFGASAAWAELVPLVRRCVDLDPGAVVRVRGDGERLSVFVWLPFEVLVARTVVRSAGAPAELDTAVGAGALLAWTGDDGPVPDSREHDWRRGLPPTSGWTRLDIVPDTVVRDLVRTGALALKDAAAREGLPGAQPRSDTAAALLDAVVLTVSDDAGSTAELSLRVLSAATRMGFVPRGSSVAVDSSGRWTRVAAGYGSVYAERPGLGLGLTPTRS